MKTGTGPKKREKGKTTIRYHHPITTPLAPSTLFLDEIRCASFSSIPQCCVAIPSGFPVTPILDDCYVVGNANKSHLARPLLTRKFPHTLPRAIRRHSILHLFSPANCHLVRADLSSLTSAIRSLLPTPLTRPTSPPAIVLDRRSSLIRNRRQVATPDTKRVPHLKGVLDWAKTSSRRCSHR